MIYGLSYTVYWRLYREQNWFPKLTCRAWSRSALLPTRMIGTFGDSPFTLIICSRSSMISSNDSFVRLQMTSYNCKGQFRTLKDRIRNSARKGLGGLSDIKSYTIIRVIFTNSWLDEGKDTKKSFTRSYIIISDSSIFFLASGIKNINLNIFAIQWDCFTKCVSLSNVFKSCQFGQVF